MNGPPTTPAPNEKAWSVSVLLLGVLSALLSLVYFEVYLRGAPRIIDATAYLLEARILETFSFTFRPPDPVSLFRGRFLLSPPGDPEALGVLFPPGYPALLALGEALGSYRIVGPFLAFSLTTLTAFVAKLSGATARMSLFAGSISALCAALHYHTADTMSHGFSALLVLGATFVVLRLEKRETRASFALLGLALGLLFATRQLTGLLFALALTLVLFPRERSKIRFARSSLLALALGLLPGLLLLVTYQKALTGSFLGSPQFSYYAASDGPTGCFGLGLGKGCEFEHGDFFRATGERGLTLAEALRTTLKRLAHHSRDVANFEAFVFLAVFAAFRAKKGLFARLFLAFAALLVGGYSLFYFDGSIPGGGARFFFELVPLEHVLLATLVEKRRHFWIFLSASLFGFFVHEKVHASLDSSQGGAPYLLERELRRLDGDSILFVDSDHAFLLGFEPSFSRKRPLVARRSNDVRTTRLLTTSGRRKAFFLDGTKSPDERIVPLSSPPLSAPPYVLEAETLWPALAQSEGWLHPSFPVENCASRGRGLKVHASGATPSDPLWVDGVPEGRYDLDFRLVRGGMCSLLSGGLVTLPGVVEFRPPEAKSTVIVLDQLLLRPHRPE